MASPASSARLVARNTSLQVAAEVVTRLASLAFYVVVARQLGERGFGSFTFALAVSVLAVTFAGFGMDSILTREVARRRAAIDRLLWTSIVVKSALGGAGVAAAILVAFAVGFGLSVTVATALIATAILLELLSKSFYASFRGLEIVPPIALSLVVERFATAILGSAALLMGAKLEAVALFYFVGSFLGLAYISTAFFRRLGFPAWGLSRTTMRWLVVTSIPVGLSTIFGVALAKIDAVILAFLKGSVEVGIYGAAYRPFESTFFLSWALGVSLLPLFSRLNRTSSPTIAEAYELGCKITACVLLPLATILALFATPIVQLLYGSSFAASADSLRILAGAAAIYGFFTLSNHALFSQHRTATMAWSTAVAVVVNVVLNLALIPSYGSQGAALAMTVSQVLLTGTLMYAAIKATGSFSPARVFLGPVTGCAAMALTTVAAGARLQTLGLAIIVYCGVLYLAERVAFPRDLAQLTNTVFRRRALAGVPR